MNNEKVLQLVDQLFHEFASSYRNEARQRAVEKLTAHNIAMPKPHRAVCRKCEGTKAMCEVCRNGSEFMLAASA